MSSFPSGEEIMAVVRVAFERHGLSYSHPEADDMLAEGYLAAYRKLAALWPHPSLRWTTIAARWGVWGALEYLDSRRSGRIADRMLQCESYRKARKDQSGFTEWQLAAQSPPLLLESPVETAWDGGFPQADARLQLWLLDPRLTKGQREALYLIYWRGLNESEAARELGISSQSLRSRLAFAMRRYRQAAAGLTTWRVG